jgi:hypothetical protein
VSPAGSYRKWHELASGISHLRGKNKVPRFVNLSRLMQIIGAPAEQRSLTAYECGGASVFFTGGNRDRRDRPFRSKGLLRLGLKVASACKRTESELAMRIVAPALDQEMLNCTRMGAAGGHGGDVGAKTNYWCRYNAPYGSAITKLAEIIPAPTEDRA